MLKKNDRVTLQIEALGSEAEGIARIDDFVVFIPFALPGETVDALIVSVKRHYAFAKVMRVLAESPQRVSPVCPHYGRCGGCSCQHMRYNESLAFKQKTVMDCFQKIARCDADVSLTLGMNDPWHYRNKTAVPVQTIENMPTAGFYAQRSHRLIPVDDCPISMQQSSLINRAVIEWMRANHITAYNENTHSGVIRHIVSRTNRLGESMVLLVISQNSLPSAEELVSSLRNCGANVVTAAYSVNRRPDNTILGDTYHTLYGSGCLHESLLGLTFRISPLSFFQVNPVQTEKLYAKALELCALTGNETVADVYCGAGTITLCFAKHVRHITGIEVVQPAIDDAKQNALLNGISNAAFVCAKAEEQLPAMLKEGFRPDVVILDPPRKGAAPEVLEAIAACGIPKVLYISCHPATQARDAGFLVHDAGYRIAACQPVDMFCQTAGIENIILLQK